MRHDAPLSPPAPVQQAADLILLRVLATMADGTPVLAGASGRQIVAVAPAGPDHCGRLAVCQPFGQNQLAVLGYVAEAAPAAAGGDLILSAGQAQLRLHADGRVRITGRDVRAEAAGRLVLRGAHIALN
jgi:hypothetical protein